MIRKPVLISLISHFVFKLTTDSKFQLINVILFANHGMVYTAVFDL